MSRPLSNPSAPAQCGKQESEEQSSEEKDSDGEWGGRTVSPCETQIYFYDVVAISEMRSRTGDRQSVINNNSGSNPVNETAEQTSTLKLIGAKARQWREKYFPDIDTLANAAGVTTQDVLDLENGWLGLAETREVFQLIIDADLTGKEVCAALRIAHEERDSNPSESNPGQDGGMSMLSAIAIGA